MAEMISTVEELDALPNGSVIVFASNATVYDVYVKDVEGGWPDGNGDPQPWRSVGDDGVPASSNYLASDALRVGFRLLGNI